MKKVKSRKLLMRIFAVIFPYGLVFTLAFGAIAYFGCGEEESEPIDSVCVTDNDCKGDRICVDGKCVEPNDPDCYLDDFQSYAEDSLINGQGNWISDDTLYNEGWKVMIHEPGVPSSKSVTFHPSPYQYPTKENNYLTYHYNSSTKIEKLVIIFDYDFQELSDPYLFISSDNSSWKEITSEANFTKRPCPPTGWVWAEANLDLTSHLSLIGVSNDVYIKFSTAGYSGSCWQNWIDNFDVCVNTE